MDMKILKGTLFGGIAYFLLGWLVYGILLADFMMSNFNQCPNRPMEEMIWWAMILSNLIYALFLTLILKWSGAKDWIDGLKTGALVGFLYAATIDFSFYSMTTMFNNFGALIVDLIVSTLMATVIGAVIVLLWGKDKTI
jgi:hypothetical protein